MGATRVVFMGSDAFSVPILRAMMEHGGALATPVEVVGVVTQPDRPAGRGRRVTANAVKLLASEAGVEVVQPERLRKPEAIDTVLSLAPDMIVVASFGQILPTILLEAPRHKALNLHPSLLPLFRGPSPVAGAILSGEVETGTTLMRMTPTMDSGPILDQATTRIEECETAGELAARLAVLSSEVLLRDVPAWIRSELRGHHQDESRATYTKRISKTDANLDWSKPANVLAREVRAFEPWPGAYTFWHGVRLRILRACAGEASAEAGRVRSVGGGALEIGTGDGVLLVQQLQLEGRRTMFATELVAGHPELIGATLSREP